MDYTIINADKTGKNIYKICRRKGITANKIREFMNFACNQTIYRWFHGKALPSLDNFYALSVLLEVDMEHLLVNDSGMIPVPAKEESFFMCRERSLIYCGYLDVILESI